MAIGQSVGPPLLRGLVYAVLGVGFWVGGLLFFNWLWNHFRENGDQSGDNV